MRRILLLGAVLAVAIISAALPVRARPAHALDFWCWDDPVFEIDGQSVSVNLGVKRDDLAKIIKAEVVVTVPADIEARIVHVDTTWFTPVVHVRHSDERTRGRGGFEVEVDVRITAKESFAYQVAVTKPKNNHPDEDKSVAFANLKHHVEFRMKQK